MWTSPLSCSSSSSSSSGMGNGLKVITLTSGVISLTEVSSELQLTRLENFLALVLTVSVLELGVALTVGAGLLLMSCVIICESVCIL